MLAQFCQKNYARIIGDSGQRICGSSYLLPDLWPLHHALYSNTIVLSVTVADLCTVKDRNWVWVMEILSEIFLLANSKIH